MALQVVMWMDADGQWCERGIDLLGAESFSDAPASGGVGAKGAADEEREWLYRSRGGEWVLWTPMGRAESGSFWIGVDAAVARGWLVARGYAQAVIESVMARPVEDVRAGASAVRPDRGRGRPAIGRPFPVRFDESVRSAVDVAAAGVGMSRSEWLEAAARWALVCGEGAVRPMARANRQQ